MRGWAHASPARVTKMLRPLSDGGVSLTPRVLRTLNATLLLAGCTDVRLVTRRPGRGDRSTTWRRCHGVATEEDRAAAERLSIWGRARRPKREEAMGTADGPVGQSSA